MGPDDEKERLKMERMSHILVWVLLGAAVGFVLTCLMIAAWR